MSIFIQTRSRCDPKGGILLTELHCPLGIWGRRNLWTNCFPKDSSLTVMRVTSLQVPHRYNEGREHAFLPALGWGLSQTACAVQPRVPQSLTLESSSRACADPEQGQVEGGPPRLLIPAGGEGGPPPPSAPDLRWGPDGPNCALTAGSVLLGNVPGEEPWSQTPARESHLPGTGGRRSPGLWGAGMRSRDIARPGGTKGRPGRK